MNAIVISEVRFLRECLAEIMIRVPQIGACRQAATLDHALALFESAQPDIVLHDVAFPGGPETASRLCAAVDPARVIVLGICETEENVLAWAEAGIAGYVPNTASVEDLVALIVQIERGEQPCSSRIAGSLLRRIATSKRLVPPSSSPLTLREREILRLVGAGLCNKDIARQLGISLGTTKTHVHNLLSKLSLQRRAEVMTHVHMTDSATAPR
jgi:two-component system nitrate/nitrite response regulator NarL